MNFRLDRGQRRFVLSLFAMLVWGITMFYNMATSHGFEVQALTLNGTKEIVLIVVAFYFGKDSANKKQA